MTLSDPLGQCLEQLSRSLDAHCLVESENGDVVAHALVGDTAPSAFQRAVLERHATLLASQVEKRRSVGALAGGPVISGELAGNQGPVVAAPLSLAGQRLGWLWLAARTNPVNIGVIADVVRTVSRACPTSPRAAWPGRLADALLAGDPLPPGLSTGVVRVWIAGIKGATTGITPRELGVALHGAPVTDEQIASVPVIGPDVAYLLLLARTPHPSETARRLVSAAVTHAAAILGAPVLAALSEPTGAHDVLGLPRDQATAALAAATRPNSCVLFSEVRAALVVDHCVDNLASLPQWGTDPVQDLCDHDRRRNSDYVRTALTWLETHGDSGEAARLLNVHVNTLRYRLRRIWSITGVDLENPDARLELHLRLRARHATRPILNPSTAVDCRSVSRTVVDSHLPARRGWFAEVCEEHDASESTDRLLAAAQSTK